jgi:hypothetical protein
LKEFAKHLKTPRIAERWGVWMSVRRGKRKPKNWVLMFNEQIDWLAKFDEPTAHEILSQSIRNDWQGLFEPKQHNRPHAKAEVKPDYSKGKF